MSSQSSQRKNKRGQVFKEIQLCWWWSREAGHGHVTGQALPEDYSTHLVGDCEFPGCTPGNRGVAWIDPDLDVALIACRPPADERIAKLMKSIPNSGSLFTCAGFPQIANVAVVPNEISVRGTIEPKPDNRFEVQVQHPVALGDQNGSPYAGLSGAAIQHNGRVIGLVRRHIRYGDSNNLLTTSVADIMDSLKRDKANVPAEIYQKLFPESGGTERLRKDLLSILKTDQSAVRLLCGIVNIPEGSSSAAQIADILCGQTETEFSAFCTALADLSSLPSRTKGVLSKLTDRLFPTKLLADALGKVDAQNVLAPKTILKQLSVLRLRPSCWRQRWIIARSNSKMKRTGGLSEPIAVSIHLKLRSVQVPANSSAKIWREQTGKI